MAGIAGYILVANDSGKVAYPIRPGTHRLDFRGEEWRFDYISRASGPGTSGKVIVSQPCGDPEGERCTRPGHYSGRTVREFYPSVIFGKIVPGDHDTYVTPPREQ